MRLLKFRIYNCFGFGDTGWVNLQDARALIYVLGRNSSGKTAFLTALRSLAAGVVPRENERFANFNDSGEEAFLQAQFSLEPSELSEAIVTNPARTRLFRNVSPEANVNKAITEDAAY